MSIQTLRQRLQALAVPDGMVVVQSLEHPGAAGIGYLDGAWCTYTVEAGCYARLRRHANEAEAIEALMAEVRRRMAARIAHPELHLGPIGAPPPMDELETRRPVWAAMATLFNANQVIAMHEPRSQVLAMAPYTLSELDAILAHEVYPVCWMGMFAIGHEVAAFDQAWLEGRIQTVLSSRRGMPQLSNAGRRIVPRLRAWQRTKMSVAAIRRDVRGW